MPKIKDLGIKIIPETMRPPEVGGGGGCTDCTVQQFSICGGTRCTDCTNQPFSICGGTRGGCTDCTVQAFSICGGTGGCTDCTNQAFSICGGTPQPQQRLQVGCSDCTAQAFSICGGTHQGCTAAFSFCRIATLGCTDCTNQPFSICGGTCACTQLGSVCGPVSQGCGAISRVCAGSIDPTIGQQTGITREQIAALKDSLRQQIVALEEHEKSIGPKTKEEIDAREKQLNEELEQLKARRKDLK